MLFHFVQSGVRRYAIQIEYGNGFAAWGAALNAKGVGHHSFALLNGDIGTSPPSGVVSPFMYHGVPNNLQMSWSNRYWYAGTFTWWENSTYCRSRNDCNTGWSLKFFE